MEWHPSCTLKPGLGASFFHQCKPAHNPAKQNHNSLSTKPSDQMTICMETAFYTNIHRSAIASHLVDGEVSDKGYITITSWHAGKCSIVVSIWVIAGAVVVSYTFAVLAHCLGVVTKGVVESSKAIWSTHWTKEVRSRLDGYITLTDCHHLCLYQSGDWVSPSCCIAHTCRSNRTF